MAAGGVDVAGGMVVSEEAPRGDNVRVKDARGPHRRRLPGFWSDWVPSEPYLLEIGNRVRVSRLVRFMTHDGSAGQGAAVFGRISVGDDTFIGLGSLILPGTTIGKNCIIGAGSVVRGMVPDGSVVMGNPAKVVMTTAMARKLSARNRDIIQVRGLSAKEREQVVRKHFGLDSGG